MEARILSQGKNEPPQLQDLLIAPIHDFSTNPSIIFCVCEGVMASGEPSVIIASVNPGGSIILHTSLDKFLAGASGMAAMAETQWGWKRPEGYASIIPPSDRKARRALMEALKKELEEWDNATEDGPSGSET